jgi:glycosyltransferase involved in cell wall biosynthesis
MWHPLFHVPGRRRERAVAYVLWRVLGARRRLHIVVHEPEPALTRLQGWSQRRFWSGAAAVLFHSAAERDAFVRTVRIDPGPRLRIIDHHASFRPASYATHEEARRRLGVAGDARIALCIGFFGPHKGFDRAIRAFAAADLRSDAQLYIVGSILHESAAVDVHVAQLRLQASLVANVTLVERYVSDEEFDLWLLASDVVILPYRTISSSSVAARARVLRRPVIATKAGGLAEQLGADAVLVDHDDELAAALIARLGS